MKFLKRTFFSPPSLLPSDMLRHGLDDLAVEQHFIPLSQLVPSDKLTHTCRATSFTASNGTLCDMLWHDFDDIA